ncbi:Protein BZZ1 [Coemansia sp. RSA 486]|nr:Protein BZZ1 [Coemansia sp. RSA 486]
MDSMQTIDEQRVNATKRLLQQMLAMQETANVQLVNGTQRTAHIVGRIAAEVDAAQFVRRRLESGASSWDEQPDFRVVVDLASGDNENMMLDGESQMILRNTCIQAQKNATKAEADAREKHMAADQSRQRAQTTTKGVERELENATTAEREATMAELEAVQYHALSDAIEQRLGHVDAGTPHEFKAFTVAISKICDYCGESIGGLNRKAGKCAQCEYTCHAKCQIKVEPNCPGRDPEAKSGFLSMFGTRRGTKKGKGERQRSQSTASVGSGASVDMTPPQPPPRTLTQQHPQQQQQQQQIGMHLSSSANASTASHSASQTSLPPRSSLSYGGGFGAATMPRTSASPLIEPSALAGAIASRTATINRVPTMTPLTPVSNTHDSATQVPVLYDFEGDGNTTLTVRAGDRVTVVAADEDGSGWTEVVVNGSQQQGLVPTSYVDMSEYRAPPRVPENRALMPPMAEMAVARDEYVVALYDFAGRDAEELSVREGDRIRVVSRDIGEGWIQGALNSHEGRLPVSYVRNE